MQNIKTQGSISQKALRAAFLSVGAAAGFSAVAQAAPSDIRDAKRDVKEARKDVKEARKDVKQADNRSERREAREDLKDARKDVKEARQDLRQERREDRRDDRRDNNWNNRYNNGRSGTYRPGYGYPNSGYNNRNNDWNNRYNDHRVFTGQVTDVESNNKFEVRISGQTFDVYTNSSLPRQLNRGDVVRVYGVRSGSNDIREANVTILNNR